MLIVMGRPPSPCLRYSTRRDEPTARRARHRQRRALRPRRLLPRALRAPPPLGVGGTAGGFAPLLLVLLAAGLGSGVQHPLSSSLVSKAYENGPRRAALGTYNFSRDLGQVAGPAAVA